MLTRWSPYLHILLGVLLLTTPALWNPSADYATVTYETQEVEYTDEYLRVGVLTTPIQGLDCYGMGDSRYCSLERYVAQHGPITVTYPDHHLRRSKFVVTDDFYRPVRNNSGENTTFDLDPVTPGTVLRELSKPANELPKSAQKALETGESVTVSTPVKNLNRQERQSSRFVTANNSYYLLQERYTAHDGVESPLETPIKVLLFTLGLRLVLRGQTKRRTLDNPPF